MESERSVLSALDSAQEGRTSITIAHRLSTVKNCSVIFVVKDGQVEAVVLSMELILVMQVIEAGDHEDLLKMRGTYYQVLGGGSSIPH